MAQTFKIRDGDILMNSSTGKCIMVTGTDKLKQDLNEFFTVHIQPSGFGAGIEQLIGIVPISSEIFAGLADRQIRDGILELRNLQRSDATIPRTTDERILGVTNVQVEADHQDPTKYFFRVNVLTESGKPVSVDISTDGAD